MTMSGNLPSLKTMSLVGTKSPAAASDQGQQQLRTMKRVASDGHMNRSAVRELPNSMCTY
jgi:hypothetical protein